MVFSSRKVFAWRRKNRARSGGRAAQGAARDGLETSGNAALAQYNDPFTNPLVRRNEIIIPVSNFTM